MEGEGEVVLFDEGVAELQDEGIIALYEEYGLTGKTREEVSAWAKEFLAEENDVQRRETVAQAILARRVDITKEIMVARWICDMNMSGDRFVTDFELFAIVEEMRIDLSDIKFPGPIRMREC